MNAPGRLLPRHYCLLPPPRNLRKGLMYRCPCGQLWYAQTVNNVFTDGPILTWARVPRWDLPARWRGRRRFQAHTRTRSAG